MTVAPTSAPGPAPGSAPAACPAEVRVTGGAALRGVLRVPGDKSISHRAVLLGALAEGTSELRGLSRGDDVRRTIRAVEALGARVEVIEEMDGTGPAAAGDGGHTAAGDGGHAADGEDGPAGASEGLALWVTGGRSGLHAPSGPLDCGNSGTSMRLLMGVVAGIEGETVLTGDESLSARPMDRVAAPLGAMGAAVSGTGDRCLPPVTVRGGTLRAVRWAPPVASAQVKSAILLAGLWAEGETVVEEAVRTRTHTEELLAQAGAVIGVDDEGPARVVRLRGSTLRPLRLHVPGDPSQAAFWAVAACVVPNSEVTVRGVYAGRERTGFVAVLARMGADVAFVPVAGAPGAGAPGGGAPGGPALADLVARHAPLRATEVRAEEIPSLDEVPALAVAAACAHGTTRFVGMAELRVKETDRLAALADLAGRIGARAEVDGDDLVVHGTAASGGAARLQPFRAHSRGDHRIAMAAAVAALAAGRDESRIEGFAAVETSYPSFLAHLRALGGTARACLLAIDGPAGSGKSTVSRALATALGVPRLDTGAMYRAVAWAALDRGVDPADAPAVAGIAEAAAIDVGDERVTIDGAVVTRAIRTPEVNRAVSVVAANPLVRAALVTRQRAWAAERLGGVVEGRDIGTTVFPRADLKVYLTASPEERARRRNDEAAEGLARRDHLDSTRLASPLQPADDARVVDTTRRAIDDVVAEILSWL